MPADRLFFVERIRRLSPGIYAALFAVGCLSVAAWPLRDALWQGRAAGAGPDVAVTLWGMWWFSVEWMGAAWLGTSTYANYPDGVVGSILSPTTAAFWALVRPAVGPALATTATDIVYLAGWSAAVAWLGRCSGLGRPAAALAGLLALGGRYLVFAVGETSIVGITAIPVVLAVGALLAWDRERSRRWLVAYAGLTALVGLEYPYLVALPPLLGGLLALRRRSPALAVAVIAGALLAWAALKLTGRGQVDSFASLAQGMTVAVAGWEWPRGEHEFARATLRGLLLPGRVTWAVDATSSPFATGREYLGLPLLGVAAAGVWRRPARTWPFGMAAAAGIALSTGSEWFGLPAPFALLNAVAEGVVRVLTQPTRFLVLVSAALPVAAAHGLESLSARPRLVAGLIALLGVDAFAFGGPSLRLPTSELPHSTCVSALADAPAGAVILWPWDGLDGGEAGMQARMWQVVHQQPGPGRGVGSWTLLGERRGDDRLSDLGLEAAVFGEQPIGPAALYGLGYRTVMADRSVGEWAEATATASLGAPSTVCAEAAIYTLPSVSLDPAGIPRATVLPPAGWHTEERRSKRRHRPMPR